MSSDSVQTIASEAELVPVNCFAALDLPKIFGRNAPFEVDLGCGDGSFLARLAAENADTDFLGIERLLGRVRAACRKIERGGLTNARVLRFEISYAVEHLLPPGSVTAFHLLFPDPWPKRRHASRRLVSQKFLAALHRTLRPRGFVRVATDDLEYFRQIAGLAAQSHLFTVDLDRVGNGPVTRFERRFRERGVAIHGLELRKISPVT
ncbi:MAG TPA: tRNA (guanosine(46)-N7)-methyltransferase TrmB [Chthoniobacterales bacterium]|nr:tRNA (guanosine(46)-N7)-methyltransferase TrmB [Chthoniobacterales bacterium]